MAFSLARNERVYLQLQSALNTIPNTTGTATVGNANACRHVKCGLQNSVAVIKRPDKTGTRTPTAGTAGRKFATWSLQQGLAANGAAGTKPDTDPLLECLFGQAGSIKSGTVAVTGASNAAPIVITATGHALASYDVVSVTAVGGNTAANGIWMIEFVDANSFKLIGSVGNAAYSSGGSVSKAGVKYGLSDSIPSFCLWSFRTPAAIEQRVVFGCVVNEAVFNLGQDVADWNASGEGVWMLTSDEFANSDSDQKGGLTAFPTEPAAPVTNGGLTVGFTGRLVLDKLNVVNVRTATLRIPTANAITKDTFTKYYGDSVEGDERQVTLGISLYDDDATATKNLKKLANSKVAIDAVIQVGTVVGGTFVFIMKGLQLQNPSYDDGQRRYTLGFGDSPASGSSITALDEVALWVM